MKMLKQVIFEMKHQKMMTWVSIGGSTLSIFLVMVFFMVDKFSTVEVAPESNRSRMLYGGQYELRWQNGNPYSYSCGSMSLKNAKKIYSGLQGVEKIAYTSDIIFQKYVGLPGKISYPLDTYTTDADFWKMYDFDFISGKPFDDAAVKSGVKAAVITQSIAQRLFERDDVIGEQISLDKVPYTVVGVIKDVIQSMRATYSMVYIPLPLSEQINTNELGNIMVHVLMKKGFEEDEIRSQVKTRFDRLIQEYAKDSVKLYYRGQPYNAEVFGKSDIRGNITPDISLYRKKNFITYSILLLLPAINLCCIIRSRLRHRISEIGVRRAFGAKKSDIIIQLLYENFLITLIGGIIGFGLSLITVYFASDYFFNTTKLNPVSIDFVSNRPELPMLITWNNFFISIGACFVLNLITAFIPSWIASVTAPAEAIAKSRK